MPINSKVIHRVSALREKAAGHNLQFSRNLKIRNSIIIAFKLEMVKNVSVETEKLYKGRLSQAQGAFR